MAIEIRRWTSTRDNMDKEDIVRLQVLLYCHMQGTWLTPTELNLLAHIGVLGNSDLNIMIREAVEKRLFGNKQSVRNMLKDLTNRGLVEKEGQYRKKVKLKKEMQIQHEGNILVELKCLSRDTNKSS